MCQTSFFLSRFNPSMFYLLSNSNQKSNPIFDFQGNLTTRRLWEEEKNHSVIICFLSSQVAAKNQDRWRFRRTEIFWCRNSLSLSVIGRRGSTWLSGLELHRNWYSSSSHLSHFTRKKTRRPALSKTMPMW